MLIHHSFAYILARGLPGLVNFAALLLYTRLLSPQDYGRYALVIAGVSMVEVAVFQWQRLVLARWWPMRRADPQRFLGEMLGLFAAIAAVAVAVGLLLALAWPDPVWRRLLLLAVALFVAQGWLELNLALASAQLAPMRYGRLLAAKSLLALGLGAGLAWSGLGAYSPLLGLLAGCLLAVPLAGGGTWSRLRLRLPERRTLREQLHYGLPLVATFMLGWVIAGSDRLIIGWLRDVQSAGQYAVGYDLAQHSLGVALTIVQIASYPLAVRALEDQGPAAAREQLRHNGELIFTLALAGAASLAVLAPQIAAVVVGSEFRGTTASLLPFIALAAALWGIKAFHFDVAFHMGCNSRGLLLGVAAAAVANVALTCLLVPGFGLQGAAVASILAYALGLVLSARLGRRVFDMPPVAPILARAGCVALAAAGGAALARSLDAGAAGLVAGVTLAVLSGGIASLWVNIANARVELGSRWQAWLSSVQRYKG